MNAVQGTAGSAAMEAAAATQKPRTMWAAMPGSMVSGSGVTKANTASPAAQTGNSSTTGGDSGVTSADFLSLLVSELKNQDPTKPNDPTAYVQQLVSVNSLQQLIAIHQALAPTTGGAATTGNVPSTGL